MLSLSGGPVVLNGRRRMETMRVSLVTTVKNEAASARRLIEAVKGQSRRPDEWIVVDGGSTDATAEHFAGEPACVLLRAGGNIAAGRNAAIAHASGPVIAVTDAGCRPAPDWLARLVEPLEAGRAEIAAGVTVPRVEAPFHAAGWALADQLVFPRLPVRKPAVSSRSLAFRRDVWERSPYPEWLDHGEDTWAVEQWLRQGRRLERVAGAVVEWDLRGSLGAFLAQQFCYMRGDGRARMHTWRHLARFAFHGAVSGLLAWGVTGQEPAAWAATALWLLYLAASVPRLLPLLAGRGWCFALKSLALLPPLLLGMDVAKMVGYLRGRLEKRLERFTT